MNARQLPYHVDAHVDAELAKLDDAQHHDDERQALIHARAEQINAMRCGKLTTEDMAIAFETLSTFPETLKFIRVEMVTDAPGFAAYLMSTVRAALMVDSIRQAREEFANLDALKTGGFH